MNAILKNCFAGIYALIQDPVGIVILLAMGMAGFLAYTHAIGDIAFSSVFAIIPTIYSYCQHRITITNIQKAP